MELLIFAAYLVFFAWLVTRTSFFNASGLAKPQLVMLFLLKVMAGILYGWIGVYYGEMAQMVDTWAFHYESLKEYRLLLSDPGAFFTSIFHNSYQQGYTRFLASESSWWNDLKGTIFIKLLAFFNLASFANYYVNVVFYSYLTLFGPVAFYRVMRSVFTGNRLPVLLATFLIPSFLYWTSGLQKEGLLFLGLSLILYAVYFGLKEKRSSAIRAGQLVLGMLLVLTLRNFLILPLLPALCAWLLQHRFRNRTWVVVSSVYALSILLFFTTQYLHPRLNFPEAVVARQEAFEQLGGGSAVEVVHLQPTFRSFVVNLPQAITLSAIRPYPADVHHLLSLAAAVEINGLLLLVLACLFFRKRSFPEKPLLVFCLTFSFSVLLMIGYSVNILGAIVRYRSIVLPLLVVPVVAHANWTRIALWLGGNSNMVEK